MIEQSVGKWCQRCEKKMKSGNKQGNQTKSMWQFARVTRDLFRQDKIVFLSLSSFHFFFLLLLFSLSDVDNSMLEKDLRLLCFLSTYSSSATIQLLEWTLCMCLVLTLLFDSHNEKKENNYREKEKKNISIVRHRLVLTWTEDTTMCVQCHSIYRSKIEDE